MSHKSQKRAIKQMTETIRKTVLCCVCLFAVQFAASQPGFCAPISGSQDGRGTSDSPAEIEQVTKWLTSHAIELKSVEEKESFADLKPLKQVLRGVRIVGLGEATHGSHEFFRLKRRLVEFLVKEEGFTLFAMELSYAASSAINDYVLYGKGG